MSFLETPRFPDLLARGLTGGPEFKTDVIVVGSGHEQRNRNWQQARLRWDAATAVRTLTEWQSIADHFYAVGGRQYGFRLRDPADQAATTANGLLQPLNSSGDNAGTIGVGYGVPTYQLYKRYTRGALTYDREIRKPASGLVTLYRAASPVTLGASAGNAAINTATGVVTFVADASSNASAVTVGATTQVVLAANPGTLTNGQRLYLSGFAGADATLLNGLSHLINSVSGSGPYTFVLATNTAGKTITLGSGVGSKYPQASEALTWAGTFDVPVRFDVDHLQQTLITRQVSGDYLVQAASIPIVEVRA